MVKDGCVLFGESNYSGTLNIISFTTNACAVLLPDKTNLLQSNTYGAYAPGWNHVRSSNFVYKDGHVKAEAFNAQVLFDSDFIPKR